MGNTWLKTSRFLAEIEKCIKEDLSTTPAHGLSVTSVYILQALYTKDGQRPMDLATAIGRAATSFTPMLDQLEIGGLIERQINKSDRRSVLIYLTKQGKQLQTDIKKAIGNTEVRYGGG